MDEYVWRVPTLLGVSACAALMLFAAAVVGSEIARRRHSTVVRMSVVAALGAVAITSGLLIRTAAVTIARTNEISIAYVDPGPTGYLGPMLFSAFAFRVGDWTLEGRWASRAALMFYGWLVTFTAINIINWCSPGWCETIGLPFTWNSWSDSMSTFANGVFERFLEHARHATGAVLNLLTFVIIARVLTSFATRPTR